jgi:hypothetical protein
MGLRLALQYRSGSASKQVIATLAAAAIIAVITWLWANRKRLQTETWGVALLVAVPSSLITSTLVLLIAIEFFGLKGENGPPGPPGERFLPGTVVAFDSPGGCREDLGWQAISDLDGRTVVGAIRDGSAPKYKFRSWGGSPTFTLSEGNLPKIDITTVINLHPVQGGDNTSIPLLGPKPADKNWYQGPVPIASIGAANGTPAAIDTVPPYLALYYCEKQQRQ